jgi:hypothetical protein
MKTSLQNLTRQFILVLIAAIILFLILWRLLAFLFNFVLTLGLLAIVAFLVVIFWRLRR